MSMEITSTCLPSKFPQRKYDVFLSFRGDDTRKGFTDHLYTALVKREIRTFKDDPELQKGKDISPEIFAAIKESRFALIIFSENYASSTWCLDELLKILECMKTNEAVLPVFYDIDPSDVRRQTGSFADSFTTHEENLRDDIKKVQRWREALAEVANFSGWVSNQWYESQLIEDILKVVWKKLRPTVSRYAKDLVGIDSRLKPIISLLDGKIDDDCFIGIWGMGGIGKTTIAREVYERISHEFEIKVFLADVRNHVEKSGLCPLQKQLLSKLGMEKDDILDVHEGVTMIRRFLCNRKVLLILDDVNHLDQLEYLAGNKEWFGSGSRVFITTRYERLLIKHEVKRRFEVEGLNYDEALQLFCWKSFKKDYPEQGYVDFCNLVVSYAKGLPLALKVLGSFLHGRGRIAWESALSKLSEVCNSDILETLKISYDGLEYNEKKIFLDIACFFNGEPKDRVREILDSCHFFADIGIDVLVEKSLLIISFGTISMHDLLQDMGQEIVRRESRDEPGKRSRLWISKEINDVLSENTGTESLEGIIVQPDEPGAVHVNAESFSKMKKLRYLKLNNVVLSGVLEYLPNSLRILEWPEFPLKSLPSSFNPSNLLELKMRRSCFEHIKPLKSLKIIDLSHAGNLVKTPDFSGVPFLEQLILRGCMLLCEIDPSVVVLEKLTLMNLKDCINLVRLPSSVSRLKSLKVLNVSGCSKLDKLPEDLGCVDCLEELDVRGTAIGYVPASIGFLKKLRKVSLPGNVVPSPSQPFRERSRNPITLWFPILSGMPSLVSLTLTNCNLSEGAIPYDIGCLSSLRRLVLAGNKFVSLPRSIRQLSKLRMLIVSSCHSLQTLPEFPSCLHSFTAYGCNSLEASGLELVKLFLNCFRRPKKQGCMITKFSASQSTSIIPGNEIPGWFKHKSTVGSSSLSVKLHTGWFNDRKLMGFSLCIVYGAYGRQKLSTRHECIYCDVSINGNPLCKSLPFLPGYTSPSSTVSSHLWLMYLPRHRCIDPKNAFGDQHEFTFSVKSSRVEVKQCGVQVLYEKDVEALMRKTYSRQSSVRISEYVPEFPNSDVEEMAVVASVSESGGVGRRGLQHCDDGAGPSQALSEMVCIDEEPHPKRSKQH